MFCKTSRKPSEVVLPKVPGNVITHPGTKHTFSLLFTTSRSQNVSQKMIGNALMKAEERQESHKSPVACALAGVFFGVTGWRL